MGTGKAPGKTGLELGLRESYRENLATDSGLEPHAGNGDIVGRVFPEKAGSIAVG